MGLNAVFGIALSGLNAATAKLSTAAGNIANADTPGYRTRRVSLVEQNGGGVRVDKVTLSTSQGGLPEAEAASDVNLATEVVELVRSKTLYAANAAVIRTADEVLGTLLDIREPKRRR